MELAFVLARGQNLFFVELVAALRAELERLGVDTSVHMGVFPPARSDLVYVLVPPHEYFTLTEGRPEPPPSVLARSIFVCAEQPGTPFFDRNVQLAPRAGAVFDINRLAVRAMKAAEIDAEHLQVGWASTWDHFEGSERDIDVLFMGAATERRLEHLSSYVSHLWDYRCHYVISDNSLPNAAPSDSFVSGDDKWSLLSRSRVLINLHQATASYFEWLRVVQAMASGCVVVSETSVGYEPLQPGQDLLFGRPETLGLLAQHVLEDERTETELRHRAYRTLREKLPLRESAEALASAGRRIAEQPIEWTPWFSKQRPLSERDVERTLQRFRPSHDHPSDDVRRVLKDLKLDLIDMRRAISRLSRAQDDSGMAELEVHRRSTGWLGATPRVTVLVSVYNYAACVTRALDSLLRSRCRSWEVVIVDDGSSDESLDTASDWISHHDTAPATLLHHPVNRGLALTRNAATAFARGEFCFILDADNEIYPNCLERLIYTLEQNPRAAFAYGMLEQFTDSGPVGLMNVFPWEPSRFAERNYIDAMALIRTKILRTVGGYRADPRLYGWEDYDLWCRMAEQGMWGAHLPSVVARYRVSENSMRSVTDISVADVRSLIAEGSPTVMAGV